jgi:hypothetical protein
MHPHRSARLLAAAGVLIASLPTFAFGAEPVSFQHGDWELACDNTRTCRAAGYQDEGEGPPVSVLLTRKAGPGTITTAQVTLGDDWEESVLSDLPERFTLALSIDGRALGSLAMRRDDAVADLKPAQTTALLKALLHHTRIEFSAGDVTWTLSDRGATAVLLKMDEAQGRVTTPGALVRRGGRAESGVLPPLPTPTVRAVALHPPLPGDARFLDRHGEALRKLLRQSTPEDDCIDLHEGDDPQPLEIVRLTKTKLLVSTRCWLAAYNSGNGYWIVEDRPPFRPVLVTTDANVFDAGTLAAEHKSRGLGDCWSSTTWTWDGTSFVRTGEMTTGQCKGFPGGAWSLPLRVSAVKKAAQ